MFRHLSLAPSCCQTPTMPWGTVAGTSCWRRCVLRIGGQVCTWMWRIVCGAVLLAKRSARHCLQGRSFDKLPRELHRFVDGALMRQALSPLMEMAILICWLLWILSPSGWRRHLSPLCTAGGLQTSSMIGSSFSGASQCSSALTMGLSSKAASTACVRRLGLPTTVSALASSLP